MIKLEDIEFMSFSSRVERFCPNISIRDSLYIKSFLKDNNITNYYQLYETLENSGDLEILKPLRYVLNLVLKQMTKANKMGLESTIYPTSGYENSSLDELTIKKTESQVNGGILLLSPPTSMNSKKLDILATKTIYELKYLLLHTNPHGESAFANEFHRISTGWSSTIVELINFFEAQVIRQHEETKATGVNLFTINKKEKELLAEEKYAEIAFYLAESPDVDRFIWGGGVDYQKTKIANSVNGKHQIDIITKKNLIEIISNYTTLSELEQGPVKTKALDRFKSTN